MSSITDVVIAGGGVIGCSIAYHLRKAGVAVTVIDQGEIGAEASSAAAGLLAPLGSLAGPGPFADLLLASFALFPTLVPELEGASGVRMEYERTGALRVVRNAKNVPNLRKRMKAWQPLGLHMRWLSGEEARQIADHVRNAHDSGVMLAGMIVPGGSEEDDELVDTGSVLGTTNRLAEVINRKRLDRIIVVNGCISGREVDECGVISKRMGVVLNRSVSIPKAAFRVEFAERFGMPLLELRPVAFTRRQEIVKRCFDMVAAAASIVILSPVILLFALLVKATSKGPVFYKAARGGRGGRYFNFFMFRPMYTEKMDRQHVSVKNEKNGHIFKVRNDPRITPVGKFLRRTSLDEFPQIINVVRGEMSLVGPRPPLPSEVALYEEWQKGRLAIKPGMTGLWQVRGRSGRNLTAFVHLLKPDGTVLLGVKFLAEVRRQQQDQTTFYNENSFFIVLHEMAHILQFKRGMAQRTDWQMEPHADFLAGWAYARGSPKAEAWVRDNLELGVRLMFSLGDTAFNDPQHHGQPEFRAAMVRAGYDSADLELDSAFERGMKYAGLR